MNNLKKIGKYFAITFSIVLVCGFVGIVHQEINKGTFYDVSTKEALSFCIQIGLSVFTSLIPYSLCFATLFTFWSLNKEKGINFFRTLAVGLVLVLPLSAITYYYDWFIRPQMIAVASIKLIEIRSTYPHELADTFSIDKEEFLKQIPSTIPKRKFIARMDSLKASFQADTDTCELLLSSLPDTLAWEAYQSYELKEMGVPYRYATHPVISKDSLMVIQHIDLYQRAMQSWDTLTELKKYYEVYFDRMIDTACIYIGYFLFAFMGYLLRSKPIKKILVILAMLIVVAYFYKEISSTLATYIKKIKVVSNTVVDKTYEEIREQRKIQKRQKKDDLIDILTRPV